MAIIGSKEYFKGIEDIKFEGKESKNPLAYKYYSPNEMVLGKKMSEHLKFAVAYWHSFGNTGIDPFGTKTKNFPWNNHEDPIQRAKDKMDAAFEFISKLGLEYFCFHDFDLIEEGNTLFASEHRLRSITEYGQQKRKGTPIKILWGTANLFSHPRYMNGAATNPDFNVVAYASAQVKNAIDVTIALEGENYVFWGGREGYTSLLNTKMKKEIDHLAQFLHNAKDYARSQGFKGHFFIEPKPAEPSKHQYDFDTATVIGFLNQYELTDDFRINIEVNHATLAGHTFQHELQVAADANMLGSIDANRGDYQNGWDTDQFPTNIGEIVEAMLVIVQNGGIQGGGVNFDAKTRRNSTDLADIFYSHIGGIDTFSRALLITEKVINHTDFLNIINKRYSSFDTEKGKAFEKGTLDLSDLHQIAHDNGELKQSSGKQELLENIINDCI
uniref:Xylose isomerase n=1 Tax=uncultured Cytophagia bacterium TaxID=768505 RepID=F4MN91_9BACT|nr:xylose isomerase [uncultured bacterium]CBL88126.1 xylose isomerase [uncultured Cytophagia bacterium]|tara:strand:- start:2765 stop:4090 length:1326 start_codon:yes stop_codon:yes gene_type:complete